MLDCPSPRWEFSAVISWYSHLSLNRITGDWDAGFGMLSIWFIVQWMKQKNNFPIFLTVWCDLSCECDRMKCWVNTNPGQLLPGKNYQARIDWQGAVRSWAPGLAEINHSRPLLCLPFSDIWRETHLGTELETMFAIYYHCQDVASGENKLTEVGR